MEANTASRKCAYMWAKLGRMCEANAYMLADSGNGLDRGPALDWAKAAEACFWQSTGDGAGFVFVNGEVVQ